jgi:hypothetical protein
MTAKAFVPGGFHVVQGRTVSDIEREADKVGALMVQLNGETWIKLSGEWVIV